MISCCFIMFTFVMMSSFLAWCSDKAWGHNCETYCGYDFGPSLDCSQAGFHGESLLVWWIQLVPCMRSLCAKSAQSSRLYIVWG